MRDRDQPLCPPAHGPFHTYLAEGVYRDSSRLWYQTPITDDQKRTSTDTVGTPTSERRQQAFPAILYPIVAQKQAGSEPVLGGPA